MLVLKDRKKSGFTLIEIIISMGLFSIVMLIALTTLFSLSAANNRVRSAQVVTDNLGFVFEDISRVARFGFNYHCGDYGDLSEPQDCPTDGDTFLAVERGENIGVEPAVNTDQVIYRYREDDGMGMIEKSLNSGSSYERITPENINVTYFRDYVMGAESGIDNGVQAQIFSVLGAIVDEGEESEVNINLQTTITQRFTD